MEFNEESTEWIKNKVISTIVGCCCDIANSDPNRFKTRSIPIDMLPSFIELSFLIKNFGNIFDKEKVISEFFADPKNKDNQWSNSQDLFNQYINMTLQLVREQKLEEILH